MNKDTISESDFHRLGDAALHGLFTALEAADARGALEVELEDGALTIILPDHKTYIISKHGVSKQLWLSSPLSGGLHFRYDAGAQRWALPDGRTLPDVLMHELHSLGIAGLH